MPYLSAEDLKAMLTPCPFCGGGEFRLDESTFWTGKRSTVLSVTLRHWCSRAEGQLDSGVQMTGKTQNDAIAAWERRFTS